MNKVVALLCAAVALAGCVGTDPALKGPQWKPIGNRKARVVHKVSLDACNLKTRDLK